MFFKIRTVTGDRFSVLISLRYRVFAFVNNNTCLFCLVGEVRSKYYGMFQIDS